MSKERKITGSNQMGFEMGKDGNFHLPTVDLMSLPETEIFLNWINQRKLLDDLSSNKTLLVNFRHNQTVITEEKNWSPQIPYDQLRLKPKSLAAIAFITPSLNNETLDNFGQRLTKAVQYLHPHHGVIFIAEEKGENSDQKTRQAVLKKSGLAKASILKPKNQPFLFWEGRLAKEHRAINLTKKPDFWPTLRIICENYQTTGYEVVVSPQDKPTSWKSLLEILSLPSLGTSSKQLQENYQLPSIITNSQQSKNPPESVSKLINGFGLTVKKIRCDGCVWEIGILGEQTKIADCGNPDCDNIETVNISPTYKYVVGERRIGKVCFDCGSNFQQIVEINKNYLWRSRISITEYCSLHGDIDHRTSWELNADIG